MFLISFFFFFPQKRLHAQKYNFPPISHGHIIQINVLSRTGNVHSSKCTEITVIVNKNLVDYNVIRRDMAIRSCQLIRMFQEKMRLRCVRKREKKDGKNEILYSLGEQLQAMLCRGNIIKWV